MITSVFILNITDMRKGNMLKKLFNLTYLGIKMIALVLVVVYLIIYLHNKDEMFLSFIAPLIFFIIFLLYNLLLVHFHKKGFYRPWQATDFYTKCSEQNLSIFQEENFEKAKDIYFSVLGTDVYLGKETFLTHMEEIYNAGRKITEKQ